MNKNTFALIVTTIFMVISCKEESSAPVAPVIPKDTTTVVIKDTTKVIPKDTAKVIPKDTVSQTFSAANAKLLDSVIAAVLVGNKIPGIVVGVSSPTLGTYKRAFGLANYVTKAPLKIDAIFDIGSVHKNFKWVVLHILEKEGQLKLDDLVNKYVSQPDLPGVTLRHLMQHSSGLCDIPASAEFQTNVWDRPTFENSYDTMMYYLNHSTGKNSFGDFTNGKLAGFTPGVNSSYSSYGSLIACEVVRKITGKNMRELITEKIIKPLGLTGTSHMAYEPDPVLLTPGHADSVTLNPFTPTAASTMGLSSANGGAIQTNVSDLLKFTESEFTDTNFLPTKKIEALTKDYLQGQGMKAGLGVIQFAQWEPYKFWGHAGFGIRSHSATSLHNVEHKLTIVVLTNIYTPRDNYQTNYAISEAIIKALY
jgi:D-alanyl-D-alanine carboxypeptidase